MGKIKDLKSYINIKGGLGNQLFQYAFYKFIKKFVNQETFIDKSWYKNQNILDTKRYFLLEKYLINNFEVTENNYSKFNQFLNSKLEKIIIYSYKHNLFIKRPYYSGYWQDIFFAKHLINTDFKETIFDRVKGIDKDYCVIHGRFLDFFTSKTHYCLESEYYEKAITNFLDDKTFYAISDDIGIMKNIVKKLPFKIEILELSEIDSFRLMFNANGGVASNSTFCWWPVYLSKNSNWIFPKFILKDKNIFDLNLYIKHTKII